MRTHESNVLLVYFILLFTLGTMAKISKEAYTPVWEMWVFCNRLILSYYLGTPLKFCFLGILEVSRPQAETSSLLSCISDGTEGDVSVTGAQGPTTSIFSRVLLPQVLQQCL